MVADQNDAENTRAGYHAAVSLWTYEGSVIWARYNAMLVANSIVMAVVGVALTSGDSEVELAMVMTVAGLFLCGAWALLNRRGFAYHERWIRSARELEADLPPLQMVSQGGLAGLTVECVSYLPIIIFGALYVAALVFAVIDVADTDTVHRFGRWHQ